MTRCRRWQVVTVRNGRGGLSRETRCESSGPQPFLSPVTATRPDGRGTRPGMLVVLPGPRGVVPTPTPAPPDTAGRKTVTVSRDRRVAITKSQPTVFAEHVNHKSPSPTPAHRALRGSHCRATANGPAVPARPRTASANSTGNAYIFLSRRGAKRLGGGDLGGKCAFPLAAGRASVVEKKMEEAGGAEGRGEARRARRPTPPGPA